MGVNCGHLGAGAEEAELPDAFLAFWIVSVLEPLSVLLLDFDVPEILRALSAPIVLGLWFLYVCLSVRVRNTLVN